MYIMRGSGKAACRLCGEKIKTDEIDVVMTGYRMEKHYHKHCIDNEFDDFRKKEQNENAGF